MLTNSEQLVSKYRQSGFTLIEVMIVVSIIIVLSSLVIPSYRTWIQNSGIRAGAESILNGLQLARGQAVARNTPVQFELVGGTTSWKVCTQPSPAGSCAGGIIQTRSSGEGSSSTVTATASTAGPYVFNSLGVLTSPASVVNIDVDNTTTLTATESRELRVVIGAGGSVKMCDPSVSSSSDPRKC